MSGTLRQRKPWPMKWIVLAIVLAIGTYTYLTLHFRKPARAYQPYEDMRTRANTGRLLAAGYQRVELQADRPSDRRPPGDTAQPAPGGLPDELRRTLVSPPRLPSDILQAHAATTTSARAPYHIDFRCVVPDDHQQLGGTELYVKGDEIIIAPRFDRLAGGLQSRSRDYFFTLTVPAGALKPGRYHVTLSGQRTSRAWSLQVK